MLQLTAVILGCGVALLALYGWGRVWLWCTRSSSPAWPVTVALGLALTVFLGGFLQLASLVNGASLAAVSFAGLLAGVLECWRALNREKRLWREYFTGASVTALVLVLGVFLLTAWTQARPAAFNVHDDFQKYFVFVERMLQTGSARSGPLSAMGLQTLGGQAFLQSFAVQWSSIAWINTADAVFGLLLCLLLLAAPGTSARGGVSWWGVLAAAVLYCVDPQYANVSTLYLGSALFVALVLLLASSRMAETKEPPGQAASTALLLAALGACKPSLLLFPGLFVLLFTMLAAGRHGVKQAVIWLVRTGLFTVLFLAPWLAAHLELYLMPLDMLEPLLEKLPQGRAETVSLFSSSDLFYGSMVLAYTMLVVLACLCAGVVLGRRCRGKGRNPARDDVVLAAALAGVGAFVVHLYVLAPGFYGVDTSLRLFTPAAIAVFPVVLLLAGRGLRRERQRVSWQKALLLAAGVTVMALFLPGLAQRTQQVLAHGSQLAFANLAQDPEYIARCQQMLSAEGREQVRGWQAKTPGGAPLLSWIVPQFQLDFRRNPVATLDGSALMAPWSRLPPFRCVILDHQRFGERLQQRARLEMHAPGRRRRLVAVRSLAFSRILEDMRGAGRILLETGEVTVFCLAGP